MPCESPYRTANQHSAPLVPTGLRLVLTEAGDPVHTLGDPPLEAPEGAITVTHITRRIQEDGAQTIIDREHH